MSKAAFPDPVKLSTVHWLICIIASIGFAFDIYELLMLPLIAKGAIGELVPGATQNPEVAKFWRYMLFFVPALAGGTFGLLGGYLTDRLGRRRVLTWSIILYAISAFLAGFSTNIYMLLFLRCLIFIGVCVEFVAAVAWLAGDGTNVRCAAACAAKASLNAARSTNPGGVCSSPCQTKRGFRRYETAAASPMARRACTSSARQPACPGRRWPGRR